MTQPSPTTTDVEGAGVSVPGAEQLLRVTLDPSSTIADGEDVANLISPLDSPDMLPLVVSLDPVAKVIEVSASAPISTDAMESLVSRLDRDPHVVEVERLTPSEGE